MRKMSWLLVALALLAVITSAEAAEVITVDPNTPEALAEKVNVHVDDARLDQKVTFEARRKSVLTILEDLSDLTGVTLRAGYNNQDWQVRDRKMNIFATDVPLRNLMESIARVMNFKWSRTNHSGTWSYRLYMDRKTLVAAERRRSLEEEQLSKLEAEQRSRLIDDFARAAAMSDADLEKLKDENPMLYMNAKVGWTALLPQVIAQVPEAEQAWSTGDMLTLKASNLPMEAQQAVRKTLDVMGGFLSKSGVNSIPADASDDLSKIHIVINMGLKQSGCRGDTIMGDVTLCWPGGANNTGFIDPDSEIAKSIARDYMKVLDGQPITAQQHGEMNSGHLQAVQEQKTDFSEPLIEHEDDPVLDVKVKLNIEGDGFDDILAAVAKASGFSLVSDSFRINNIGPDVKDQEATIKSILDSISSIYRYNWQRQDSVIEFRDRDWFSKRAAQIPESWMDPWRKSLIDKGVLDFDQVTQVAMLSYEQIRENIIPDEVLGKTDLASLIFHGGDFLKAYRCLDKSQQDAVFTSEGLDLRLLSPSQWAVMSRLFRGIPEAADPNVGIKLRGERVKQGTYYIYRFTAETSTGMLLFAWSFETPKYEPPKKDESEDKI